MRTLDRLADGTSDAGVVYTAERVVDTRGEDAPSRRVPNASIRAAAETAAIEFLADPVRAQARGWLEREDSWFHPDEADRLRKGDRRDPESWTWTSRKQRKKEGVRVDDAWYPSEHEPQIEAGLWPVEGEWIPLEEADVRHARISTPWLIPAPHVRLESTTSRKTAFEAIAETSHCLTSLERALGVVPPMPLNIVLLRNEEQYDQFAVGAVDGRRPPSHAQALNLIHSAFFAELRTNTDDGKRFRLRGSGIGMWDADYKNGDAFGRHAARLAYALSWIDAIDPSPKAIKSLRTGEPALDYTDTFEAEKRLPMWLRWGVAVYVERYFFDDRIDASDPNAKLWWARDWSLQNLGFEGGRTPLEELFRFDLVPADRSWSRRLMLTAGAAVAFALDGGCEDLEKSHAALIKRLKRGASLTKELRAFEEALFENQADFDAFLGEAALR